MIFWLSVARVDFYTTPVVCQRTRQGIRRALATMPGLAHASDFLSFDSSEVLVRQPIGSEVSVHQRIGSDDISAPTYWF
jgi:hypothetical protein